MQLTRDVALAPLTTIGVGGHAAHFVEAGSQTELVEALRFAREMRLSVHVLGGGSNLVIADAGVPGLVLRVHNLGLDVDGTRVTVGAGESLDALVEASVANGLAGLECLSGIPGSAGATPIQNVGAYGQEISETLSEAVLVDRTTLSVTTVPGSAFDFGYRTSRLKRDWSGRFVVASLVFALSPKPPSPPKYPELARALADSSGKLSIQKIRAVVLSLRRKKSMLYDPKDPWSRGCGSFFLNPIVDQATYQRVLTLAEGSPVPAHPHPPDRVKLSAGYLIEAAGLMRGTRLGNVGLSPHHALALLTYPGATASEVVAFAELVRERVRARFEITLAPEPHFWGFEPPPFSSAGTGHATA